MDRTAQRAEIKGRRGDEFVKKAEAGQQHASRTSKRQDEMKSNRCPSPPLLETLFSSPFASPSSFLYPLSFLGLDFLLPLSAPFFFSLFFPPFCLFSTVFGYSTSASTPVSIYLYLYVFFSLFGSFPTSSLLLPSFSSICLCPKCSASGSLERASRRKTRGQRETESRKRACKPFTRGRSERSVHRANQHCFSLAIPGSSRSRFASPRC